MSELEIPASDGGYDAQRRDLKGRIAAATTAGDTGTVEELEGDMRKLDADHNTVERKTVAAVARREAAEVDGGGAKTKAPTARTTPPKATTATVPAEKKS